MPLSSSARFRYAIDPRSRLAVARMAGTLTGADMQLIVRTVHQDPAWDVGCDAIWDCSEVAAHVVQPPEVEPLISEVVDGQTGRDILLSGPGLSAELFSKLLVLRLRRRGDAAERVQTLDEALAALGRDTMPAVVREVLSG